MITIVIPAYNRQKWLGATLESVYRQRYRPLRVVLVDNGSTDDTPALMQQFAAEKSSADFAVKVLQEPTRGAAAARNCGLAAVETEWTMFFDSDDTMAPDHVERAVKAIEAHPEVDIFGWDLVFTDGKNNVTKRFSASSPYYNCIQHGIMGTQRYIARTEMFRRAGGWNTDLSTWDDIELGVRLLRLNPKIARVSGSPSVLVNTHDDSITGASFSQRAEQQELALDTIEKSIPEAMRHWVDVRRAVLAGRYSHEGSKALAKALISKTLAAQTSRTMRILLRLAYHHTAAGLPGAARILKLVLPS